MKCFAGLGVALVLGMALQLMTVAVSAAPTLISDPTTDAQTLNINAGVAMLSNGGHANLYLHQTSGDQATWEPMPAYSAQVLVFNAANQLVATVTADEPANVGDSVINASIAPLANGGFVVAWTSATASGDFGAVYYETFAEDGTPAHAEGSRHKVVSTRKGNQIAVAGLTGGGFAVVFASGDNAESQRDFVCTFSYGGDLASFTKVNEVQLGWPGVNITTAIDGTARIFISTPYPRIAGLSDGSFVVMEPTYVWVRSTYTPLGDHVYKFASSGEPANFANGFPHLRVNWSQVNASGDLVALKDGGFATFNRSYHGFNNYTWELNIFNNDGTLVVANPQTQQIPQDGSNVVKSYNAIQVAMAAGGSSAMGAITESGDNVVMAFTSNIGFDIAQRSKTTGAAVGSIVDSGVAPAASPAGRYLTNPRLAPSGEGGWGMTYDDAYTNEDTWYSTASTYKVGFVAANSSPTISDVTDRSTAEGTTTGAIVFTIGDAETATASLVVTGSSSDTTLVPNTHIVLGGSDADRTVTVTPVSGQTGTTTITLTVEDANGATVADSFVLTVNDTTLPTVVSVQRLAPVAQTIGPDTTSVVFRVTYSESVTNVTAADFAIQALNGGNVTGAIGDVTGVGATRDVTVGLTGGSGEFRLEVRAVD